MKLLHAGIARGTPWAAQRGLTYLMNAHRLDFETSGIILLGIKLKSGAGNLFGPQPVKTYLALSHGNPVKPAFEVDASLAPHPVKVGSTSVGR